ncbi:MAG TPA: S41 family peptidase [Thermoanaerobaculia bacterium]|nr:S41 family peptidase [Thermoanaerobaculia bacterium]
MFITLLLAAALAAPPHIDRVAETGRVWAAARYYHPYSLTRDLDWDAMLVDALKAEQKTDSDDAEIAAIRAMLARLGDPMTTVRSHSKASTPRAQPPAEVPMQSEGGKLTIDLRAFGGYPGFMAARASLKKLHDEIAKASDITFDLRAPLDEEGPTVFDPLFDSLAPMLTNKEIAPPPQRFVIRSGYPPQTGSSSGGYYNAVGVMPSNPIKPEAADAPAKTIRFLVNETTVTPVAAIALRDAGIATIEGTILTGDAPMTLPLRGDREAAIRTIEIGGDTKSVARNDDPHREMTFPSLEWRWLAVIRAWAVIHYFYPYHHLIGDWDSVLPEYLERMEKVSNAGEYARTILEMMTHVEDQHVGVFGTPAAFQVSGVAWLPIETRIIEGKLVVTGESQGLEPGDVITSIDGESVASRLAKLGSIAPAATPAGKALRVAQLAVRGPDKSTAHLTIEGAGGTTRDADIARTTTFDQPAKSDPPYRVLDGNIGYADLRRLERAQVDAMFDALANTKAIIFDMRGYPRGTAWTIAPRINTRGARYAAEFHRPELNGESYYPLDISFKQELPKTDNPLYRNPTVMLVDERAISQAEHTGLFFEAANGTQFIGSQTAGTNGDVTTMVLPGGLVVPFTGHDVRHADGRQLQRIGLVPVVEVKPTIAGIRAGRDEVLERAIAYVNTR